MVGGQVIGPDLATAIFIQSSDNQSSAVGSQGYILVADGSGSGRSAITEDQRTRGDIRHDDTVNGRLSWFELHNLKGTVLLAHQFQGIVGGEADGNSRNCQQELWRCSQRIDFHRINSGVGSVSYARCVGIKDGCTIRADEVASPSSRREHALRCSCCDSDAPEVRGAIVFRIIKVQIAVAIKPEMMHMRKQGHGTCRTAVAIDLYDTLILRGNEHMLTIAHPDSLASISVGERVEIACLETGREGSIIGMAATGVVIQYVMPIMRNAINGGIVGRKRWYKRAVPTVIWIIIVNEHLPMLHMAQHGGVPVGAIGKAGRGSKVTGVGAKKRELIKESHSSENEGNDSSDGKDSAHDGV